MFNFLKKKKTPELLSEELMRDYKDLVKSNPELSEIELSQLILLGRYFNTEMNRLAEDNKSGITDLSSCAYCILNMEFPGGRNQESLADMYFISLKKLSDLGQKSSKMEFNNLQKLINKATSKGIDEIDAIRFSITKGLMHKREDFEQILEQIFED